MPLPDFGIRLLVTTAATPFSVNHSRAGQEQHDTGDSRHRRPPGEAVSGSDERQPQGDNCQPAQHDTDDVDAILDAFSGVMKRGARLR